jgi:hypothetical protein
VSVLKRRYREGNAELTGLAGHASVFLMGSGVSRFLPRRRIDVPDCVTGLTERQKRAIQENWRLVYRDLKGNGVELFVR